MTAHRLRCIVRACQPGPSLIVAGASSAICLVVAGPDRWPLAVHLGLAMMAIQFAIGLSNDAIDAPHDQVYKPSKPIPSGCLTSGQALQLAAVAGVIGVSATAPLGVGATLLIIAGLGCGLLYNFWLKRTWLSWLPLSVALPIVAAWVLVAADEWRAIDGGLLATGPVFGLAIHLANQAGDVERERGSRMRSLAHRLGTRLALGWAAMLMLAASGVVMVLVAVEGLPYAAAGTGVAGALGAAACIVAGLSRRPGHAFPLLALAIAVVAVLALGAVHV